MDKATEEIIDELHKIREENYESTKHLSPEQWAILMNERTSESARNLGLKVKSPRPTLK